MKLKALLLITLSTLASTSVKAVTTLQFSLPGTGVAGGFANSAGVKTNGMLWGVVVSTNDSSFASSGTNYDPFDVTTGSQFLKVDGVTTDDFFVYRSGLATVNAPNETAPGGVTSTGAGALTNINTVPFGSNGIDGTDRYGIIWFETSLATENAKYGFFTDSTSSNFLIGGDNIQNKAAYFNGPDTLRSASNTFTSASPIPEPSRVLFLGLGALGMMLRRRRK
jgi:hypothetical protein